MKRVLFVLVLAGATWLIWPTPGATLHDLWLDMGIALGSGLQVLLAAGFMLLLWKSATFRATTWEPDQGRAGHRYDRPLGGRAVCPPAGR